MISVSQLLPSVPWNSFSSFALEFLGTLLTFFLSYLLVKRLGERQKLRLVQRKKLDDDEPLQPVGGFAGGLARDPPCSVPEISVTAKTTTQQAKEPEPDPPVILNELSQADETSMAPVTRKEPKSKKNKPKKQTATQEIRTPPGVSGAPVQEEADQPKLQVPESRADEEKFSDETMDFGFEEVMPSKKALRKEAHLRPKANATSEEAKPKPHCPPPSHRPVQQPHCAPPCYPPVMPPKAEDAEHQTVVPSKDDSAELQATVQDEIAMTVQTPVVEESGASSQTAPVQSQSQLLPLDKEILNLEKKVREIEKLQEMKAMGRVLDKKQQEKIERAGDIGLKLSQLYSAKFVTEQKNAAVAVTATTESFDTSSPQQEPTVLQKKRARNTKGASARRPKSHTPVVVPPPPRVQAATEETQSAIQSQMNQMLVNQVLNQVAEESEDFEMLPLDVPDHWGNASQFDFAAQWSAPVSEQVDSSVAENWPVEFDDLVCEPVVGQSKQKDDCWEWITTGECPRGTYCRWNHRPMANGAADTSVFALNLGFGSDTDRD
jgi:hypothetical protein